MGLLHRSEAKVFARQLPSHNPSRALNSERRHANTRRSNGHWGGRSSPSDEGNRHSAHTPCHSRMGELRSDQCPSHSNGRRGDSHGSEADCPGCERYRDSSPAHACPEKMASKQNYFHAGRHGIDAPKDVLQWNRTPVAKETGGVLIRSDPKHTLNSSEADLYCWRNLEIGVGIGIGRSWNFDGQDGITS